MARFKRSLIRIAALTLVAAPLAAITPTGTEGHGAPLPCPAYPNTVFLGDYPSDSPGWTDNVQGVAHDASNWFFTTQSDAFLIKFPVGFDLATEFDPEDSDTWPSGALAVPMPASLENAGYAEMKDLDQANGFLFVPVAGEDPDTEQGITGIAVFTTTDLVYLGFYQITEIPHASFAAFNRHDGYLYVSRPSVSKDEPLRRFDVNFDALLNGPVAKAFTPKDPFPLMIDPPLGNMQGGVFTPWGDLYLVNGGANPPSMDRGGIHLFNSSGQLIDESTNGGGTFAFTYDPAALEEEEPEGADWWNRDVGPGSPGITGQLHVILLDNDVSEDELFLKHYSVDYSCIAAGDEDGDGLTNGDEIYITETDPRDADTDGDDLADGVELNVLGTDPLDTDSDDDSVPDGAEDADQDGLSNADEVNVHGTNPANRDTDGDQVSDGDEVRVHHTDPLDADSDNDGLNDGEEVSVYGTDPLDPDTDDDQLTDGEEVLTYHTDPLDPDSDDDELNDGLEVKVVSTDPLDSDTDDDGLKDGEDVEFIENVVNGLPAGAFSSPALEATFITRLEAIELQIAQGHRDDAMTELGKLLLRVNGCGAAADSNDWIVVCPHQLLVRGLIELLATNLAS